MKVALVHDYLYDYGGAERVLEALHELWPQAPIFTAFVDWPWLDKNQPDWLAWKIVPSWFDRLPYKEKICSPLRFLAPYIWGSFDLSGFDLVISSSAWFSCKGVKTPKNTVHICYCHTPPRYLYGYPDSTGKKNLLVKTYAALVNPFMRRYDYATAQKVDYFICNSLNVKDRIRKFYKRDAIVIYPPVIIVKQLNNGAMKQCNDGYYLMVNRLVWHKRVDLAIQACRQLKLKLKIVGRGRTEVDLKTLASGDPLIEFLGYVDQTRLNRLYSRCKAVLYLAQEEDFGITPVEAMAWGKPVIALRSGGIIESVVEDKTGYFVEKPDVEALISCLTDFEDRKAKRFDPKAAVRQAALFSGQRFKQEIRKFAEKVSKKA